MSPFSESKSKLVLTQVEILDGSLLMFEEAAEPIRTVALFELFALLSFVVLMFNLLIDELVVSVSESTLRPISAVSKLLPILAQFCLVARINHCLVSLVFVEPRRVNVFQIVLRILLSYFGLGLHFSLKNVLKVARKIQSLSKEDWG